MDVKTYPEFSTRYPLLLTTFMRRPVEFYPNEIGVVYRNADTGQYYRFTWLQWYQRTCQLAHALKNVLGVEPGKKGEPGDRVATMAYNTHRHLELYYAPSCIGATLHPVNIRLSQEHMAYTINHAGDKVIFFDDSVLPTVEAIYDKIKGTVKKFVYMSDTPGLPKTKVQPLYEYDELLKKEPPAFDWPYLDENSYATICYTTGTTGLPKGVMFTHRQLYLISTHLLLRTLFNADPALQKEKLGDATVYVINTPLFHIHGWDMPYYGVFSSSKVVLPGRFTAQGFCELVQTEKVTTTRVVPTMLAMLVEYKDLKKYDLSSLMSVQVGGGALSLGLKKKAEGAIPGFVAVSGYGMTETAPSILMAHIKSNLKDLPEEKLDEFRVKTGQPMPGIEIKVVDEKGNRVRQDDEAVGEIVVRGPWVMEKYYNDPEKTAAVWREEWFHTGDLAKVDQHGYFTIADRVSDMIRSGAEMVPTILLENIVAMADYVVEAAFVGVPDDKWGQRPMAMVKLVAGATQNEEDVYHFLETEGVDKGKITRWMLPEYICFCNDIPKTSVGKFDKLAIKKRLNEFLAQAKKVG